MPRIHFPPREVRQADILKNGVFSWAVRDAKKKKNSISKIKQ